MQRGMIGLRMGADMVRRLPAGGRQCIVCDMSGEAVQALARELIKKGIHYVDVGTSGGVRGLERGYCMMIGGEADFADKLLSAMRYEFGGHLEKPVGS